MHPFLLVLPHISDLGSDFAVDIGINRLWYRISFLVYLRKDLVFVMEKPDYDGNLKDQPDEMVLALLHMEFPWIGNRLEPLPQEVHVRMNLRNDYLARITDTATPGYVHIEWQKRYTKDIPVRMTHYCFGNLAKLHRTKQSFPEYLSMVILLTDKGGTPEPKQIIRFGKGITLELTFHYLLIYDMKWEELPPIALSLAPFCKNGSAGALTSVVKTIISNTPPEYTDRIIFSLAEHARGHLHLSESTIKSILGKEGIAMQYMDKVILDSKLVRGKIKKEKAKGKLEGKLEVMMATFDTLWQKRFGTLPSHHVQDIIRSKSVEQLQELLSYMLDETEEEMLHRLGQ